MLLFQHHLKNIIARLWTREERKRIFQCFFIIFLLSLIERKRFINIVIISIFHLLIVQFHLSRAFQKKKRKREKFNPSLLNSSDQDLRKLQVEMLSGVFRQMTEYSNNNLKRNADFLLVKSNKKADNIPWVGSSKQRFDSSLYKLTFWTNWYRQIEQTELFFRWFWLTLLLFLYLSWSLVDYLQVFTCERSCKLLISQLKILLYN